MADRTFVGDDYKNSPRKFKDMGDGSFARVIYIASSAGATNITLVGDKTSVPQKLKDMGDGTFAPVKAGVNF